MDLSIKPQFSIKYPDGKFNGKKGEIFEPRTVLYLTTHLGSDKNIPVVVSATVDRCCVADTITL